MIEQVNEELKGWALRQAGVAAAVFGPLPAGTPGLQFSLLDILPSPAPRGSGPVPIRFTLRYLVTANHAPAGGTEGPTTAEGTADLLATGPQTPMTSHVLLGQVLLAAMRDPDMQEELGVVPPALFQALGWPLQPAFYLNVPVVIERDVTPVPLVREHLIDLRPWPAARISARVVGPDNRPLPGVQVSQGGTSITTDEGGRFSFPVMHQAAPLSVRWKGVAHEVSAVAATDSEDSPEQLAAQQDVQIRLPEPS